MRSPYRPFSAADAKFTTSMAKQIADSTVHKVRLYEVDAQASARIEALKCRRCWYLANDVVAGQDVTSWNCRVCAEPDIWGNTTTPLVCEACADIHHLCRQCGGDIHMRTTRSDWPKPREL